VEPAGGSVGGAGVAVVAIGLGLGLGVELTVGAAERVPFVGGVADGWSVPHPPTASRMKGINRALHETLRRGFITASLGCGTGKSGPYSPPSRHRDKPSRVTRPSTSGRTTHAQIRQVR
jgi:hypothetical protein